jgi:hypothetical protein
MNERLTGRAESLLRILEDMLRKDPYTGISLHMGSFTSKRNLESGEGLVYRGAVNDE